MVSDLNNVHTAIGPVPRSMLTAAVNGHTGKSFAGMDYYNTQYLPGTDQWIFLQVVAIN